MELYRHNRMAYESALSLLTETGKAAVVHPTGTGKSFIAFQLCEDHPDKRVLWLSPSEYIFKTQIENLKETGAEVPGNIIYFTYASLANMSEEEMRAIAPDFMVWDEFHRAGSPVWGAAARKLREVFPSVPVLGLSATAIRYLDNQRDMADELFEGNVASEMTLGKAIVRGILNPPRYVTTVYAYQNNLEKYKRRVRRLKNAAQRDKAEEILEALRRALEKADGLDVIFQKHMTDPHGKYIVFCANKERMDEMMEKAGEWFRLVDEHPRVYSLYSEDPDASKSFEAFKKDEHNDHLRLLYCIDALNEGIHVENVSGVILLRPTVSPIIYKQQIGRALSAGKKTDAVIFDIVMNIENLVSIDAVREEMRVALTYYRSFGEREIVYDHFTVLDELRNCRELFAQLNDTLTASWDAMYAQAKKYYDGHGHLDIPKRFKTPEGYSLGAWVDTQRRVYHGEVFGVLGENRIAKLNAIGMEWDSFSDRSWRRFFAAAKEYAQEKGDLRVPAGYATKDGVALGAWIANLRVYYRNRIRGRYLSDERIAALNELGMVWSALDYQWEKNYNAAMQYHRAHGNLQVPCSYISEDHVRLGAWISGIRKARKEKLAYLTEEKIAKLDELGMVWENRYQRQWERGFAAAERYFRKNGNLNVPNDYRDETEFPFGRWIWAQRESFRAGRMPRERADRLNALGMVWERGDLWEIRFSLAEEYFRKNGNLAIPAVYTVNGIALGKWLDEQKQAYRGKRPKHPLTEDQIKRLEGIGIDWRSFSDAAWETRYQAVRQYFEEHKDIDIPAELVLSDGKKIGSWFAVQRKRYAKGELTPEQITKLNAVHMVWRPSDPWETGFEHAKKYAAEHGHLLVAAGYVCEDGYRLGFWVSNQRSMHNHPAKYRALTDAQTRKLESIGMVWQVTDQGWRQFYQLAEEYFRLHGHLKMPARYKASDGSNLQEWLRYQRQKYREGKLSKEKATLLEKIGMDWLTPSEREWEDYYSEASQYYLYHGNLDVPVTLRTTEGLWLGRWVRAQKQRHQELQQSGANGNQILRLEKIGMKWEEDTNIRSA